MGEEDAPSLGCDSIERLWLAAAVNEMFCLYDAQAADSLLIAKTFGEWIDILDQGWNHGGQRITFSTSGSSGAPKRCTHEMAHLQREVAFLAEYFTKIGRIFALTPPHHIYGFLFTAMLPAAIDAPVLQAETLSPGTLTRALQAGDLIVSIPTRWELLARSIPNWPSGVHGVTSTSPCPEPLKHQLMQHGLQHFTEFYGSSETGGIGLRAYPEPRYTLMPFWTWAARDEEGAALKGSSGERVTLQDRLGIAPDGSFDVRGRLDGAVQVGGVNVFPGRIEELLRAVPGVAEASVRLSTGAGEQRLKAFIVPDRTCDQTALAQTLDRWALSFSAPERVRAFAFGEQLPRSAMGKLADWQAS